MDQGLRHQCRLRQPPRCSANDTWSRQASSVRALLTAGGLISFSDTSSSWKGPGPSRGVHHIRDGANLKGGGGAVEAAAGRGWALARGRTTYARVRRSPAEHLPGGRGAGEGPADQSVQGGAALLPMQRANLFGRSVSRGDWLYRGKRSVVRADPAAGRAELPSGLAYSLDMASLRLLKLPRQARDAISRFISCCGVQTRWHRCPPSCHPPSFAGEQHQSASSLHSTAGKHHAIRLFE